MTLSFLRIRNASDPLSISLSAKHIDLSNRATHQIFGEGKKKGQILWSIAEINDICEPLGLEHTSPFYLPVSLPHVSYLKCCLDRKAFLLILSKQSPQLFHNSALCCFFHSTHSDLSFPTIYFPPNLPHHTIISKQDGALFIVFPVLN